ncbi:hypothetical protein AAHH79_35665, partial [Burkholderia pseudomallei]
NGSAAEVFDEIRRFAKPNTGNDLRGASHAALRATPLQWPGPPEDGRDRHPIRYLNDGASRPRVPLPDGRVPPLAFPTPSGKARF